VWSCVCECAVLGDSGRTEMALFIIALVPALFYPLECHAPPNATGHSEEICFPPICRYKSASIPGFMKRTEHLAGQPQGYDYMGCPGVHNFSAFIVAAQGPAPPPSPPRPKRIGCGSHPDDFESDRKMLPVWIIAVLFMFYGLAHVCEDFLVPGLNIMCERVGIPEDVAGATLMAAGCNAPELFASVIGVFLEHSTVGAGTVLGSAPFNILCICGAASLAVGGKLAVNGWLMLREVVCLSIALALFLVVINDSIVLWYEALALTLFYLCYTLLCIYYRRLLSLLWRTFPSLAPHAELTDEALARLRQLKEAGEASGGAALRESLLSGVDDESVGGVGALSERDDAVSEHDWADSISVSVPPSEIFRDPTEPSEATSQGAPGTRAPLLAAASSASLPSNAINAPRPPPPGAPRDQRGTQLDESLGAWDRLVEAASIRCQQRRAESALRGWDAAFTADGQSVVYINRESGERQAHPPAPLASDSQVEGPRIQGVLLKKSPFYSFVTNVGIRLAARVWQPRHFVLDGHPTHPLRYSRLASDGSVLSNRCVVIDLRCVENIELIIGVGRTELQLSTSSRTFRLRSDLPGPGPGVMDAWFEELIVRIEELRSTAEPGTPAAVRATEEELDAAVEHEAWYKFPSGTIGRVLHTLVLPLKAMIHLTVPDVSRAAWISFYPLTLILSIVWLGVLAYVMTFSLDKIGCALGVSSTVMGLTLGAIGTSFPNLYASILTARQGQAGMSICQAFGSNTFNVCICLGLVWLLETGAGTCVLGSLSTPLTSWCAGCYMPLGVTASCPFLSDVGQAVQEAGSLQGTAYVVYGTMLLFVLTLFSCNGSIPRAPASMYFVVYLVYVVYEILATYGVITPLCTPTWCL
jgi:K+-dependent Na+/Ca+ exchanger-like protein